MDYRQSFQTDCQLFKKYQRPLLRLSNTRFGRWLFGIKGHPKRRKFSAIYPNAVEWRDGIHGKLEILTCDHYANQLRYLFRFLRFITAGVAWQTLEGRALFALPLFVGTVTTTIQSSASAITGYVAREGAIDQTWNAIRIGAGTAAVTNDIIRARWNGSSTPNQFNSCRRGHFMFDTSIFGLSTIASMTIDLYITTLTTPSDATASRRAVHIVGSSAASATSLATTDYGNVGGTSFGNIDFASLSTNAYNTWTMNAQGIGNINSTGVSKFAMISGADLADDAPTTTGSSDEYHIRAQGHNDANKPKLNVTFTLTSLVMNETLTETEALNKTEARTLTETITQTESFLEGKTYTKTLTEAISLTESMPRTISRTMTETVTYTDTIATALNSIVWNPENRPTPTNWTNESLQNATWTPETRQSTTWTQETRLPPA